MASKVCVFLIAVLCQVFLSSASSKFDIEGPIVQTPKGKVQGIVKKSEDVTYLQFNGIPYALPPTGKRRFAPPKPMNPWTGTWIANSTYTCIQVDHYDEPQEGVTKGQEDCLYLNVFTPGEEIKSDANLDVIVNIHGGGFMFGSAYVYSFPKYFMDKNVVFVSINYRLGIFGFMSLEDKYLSGNLGMKDQVLALQWIQENIKFFGGNPNSVTISGLSAGGASVHFHTLSPMSKGLFHKAISASGNALDPWTIHEAPRQKAKQVGKAVGCVYENSKEFLACLKSRSVSQIVETTKLFRDWIYLPFSPFGLVVDSQAKEPFLPEHPYKLLDEGKINDVPWLASLTTAEGLYPVCQLPVRPEYFDEFEKNFEKYLPPMLHYELTVPKTKMNEVTQQIKKEYLKDQKASKNLFTEIIQMASDRLFGVGMEQSVRMHAKAIKSPVYYYSYDYTPEQIWTIPELLFGYKDKYGVSHGDDILMIFEPPMKPSENDKKITDYLVDTYVNFAKAGKPTRSDWTPIKNDENIDYLYIGQKTMEMRKTTDLGNKKFWESLPIIENEKIFRRDTKDEL